MEPKKICASIIIPAYNESQIISLTIKEIKEKLNNKIEAEIIVVDDGSVDGTYLLAGEAGAKVIRLDANHGYGYALKTGLKNASFENIVIFSADGESDPKDILKFLEIVDSKKADIAFASYSISRSLSNKIASTFLSIVLKIFTRLDSKGDLSATFIVFKKSNIDKLDIKSEGMHFATELLVKASDKGLRIIAFPILNRRRNISYHVSISSKIVAFWRYLIAILEVS